jgi:heme-degrading monooxygenase HmoA
MFAVLFEVHPKSERWDDYLGLAKLLKPELEQIDGFIENIRYRSLIREGWLLSLSVWHDEKAVVRWRTQAIHHGVQEKGRFEIFSDYHLRVGQLTKDTGLPPGEILPEQRLDETVVGEGTVVTLADGKRSADWVKGAKAQEVAAWLGLEHESASGRIAWDVFDAVLTPGDVILLSTWRDPQSAEAFERRVAVKSEQRRRNIRVIRDYGMFDRREAPQYYAEVPRR